MQVQRLSVLMAGSSRNVDNIHPYQLKHWRLDIWAMYMNCIDISYKRFMIYNIGIFVYKHVYTLGQILIEVHAYKKPGSCSADACGSKIYGSAMNKKFQKYYSSFWSSVTVYLTWNWMRHLIARRSSQIPLVRKTRKRRWFVYPTRTVDQKN